MATNNTNAATVTATLHYRRAHPGGGALGRVSYGLAGVPGIVVFDLGLFAGGIAPATITLNVAMAAPMPRNVAGVTSAVVAAGNTQAAQAASTAIAAPAAVAAIAGKVAGKVVRAAARA